MPKPKPKENREKFLNRCIPYIKDEKGIKENDQAAAICHGIYDQYNQKNEDKQTMNKKVLKFLQNEQPYKFTQEIHNELYKKSGEQLEFIKQNIRDQKFNFSLPEKKKMK